MMSDDYVHYGLTWPVLTEDDFAQIDQACEESNRDTQIDKGAARISVEVEQDANGETKSGKSLELPDSPYSQFRQRGYLSVSDVVSPAWCEVQFDYGLRQRRFLPLKSRPKTFVTEKGKKIKVKVDVAARNDRVLTKGKAVHKVLEEEIHKEKLVIPVKSVEETWALRLLDVLTRLKTMKESDVCRELPVWGIVHDEALLGTIDEIHLVSNAPSTNTSESDHIARSPSMSLGKRKHANPPSPSQTSLTTLFTIPTASTEKSDEKSDYNPVKSLHTMMILDSKTRKHKSIPPHDDTISSRLQLMLYWRLLGQVISLDFNDFREFCARIRLRSKHPFSEDFKIEIRLLAVTNQLSLHFLDATCLEEMVVPYTETINDLGIGCNISKTLSLVYRMRGVRSTKPEAFKEFFTPTPRKVSNPIAVEPKFADLASTPIKEVDGVALEGELKLVSPMDASLEIPAAAAHAEADATDPSASPSKRRKRRRLRRASTSTETVAESDSTSGESDVEVAVDPETVKPESARGESSGIIGTKKFQYNEKMLDEYMDSVLNWWHGKRPPRGVEIKNTNRCHTCEYKDGCEWRESKTKTLTEIWGSSDHGRRDYQN